MDNPLLRALVASLDGNAPLHSPPSALPLRAMQWLLCGEMTKAVAEAMVRHGQQVHQAGELGLAPDADVLEVLKAAGQRQWDILTTDKVVAAAPFERGHPFPRTIVFLQLEGGDVEQDDAIDRLFDRYKRLAPKRLYSVTATRVKIRQLPSTGGEG